MVKRFGAGTVIAVFATVLIWSTTFAALVAALDHFSPQHLLFLRWTLTALLFAGYAAVTRMRLPERGDIWRFVLAGLLGFGVYQLLLVNGQTGVSAAMAGFLVNMSPVFTTVIGVARGSERSSGFVWGGLVLCVTGLVVMGIGAGGFGAIGPSALLVVLAALSFSLYTLTTKPLLARYRPLEVTTYSVVAGSLPFLFFAPGSMEALRTASPGDLFTLLFLALFPGGIAYVLWSRSVAGMPPGLAARFLYLIPVLGLPIAWAWVGEAPDAMTVLGGLVTIAGVAIATIRPRVRTDLVPAQSPSRATAVPATSRAAAPGTAPANG